MADDDPLERLLRGSRLSNPQRAMAWDAYTQVKTADELKLVLDNINLPADVKAGLWGLKEQEAPQAAPKQESFGRALWNTVNPIEAVKGLYHAVESPEATGRTAQALVGAQVDQAKQAWALAQQGRISEAVGHAGAAALPLLGPAAAHAGERIGSGDVEGGLGETAGLLLPFGAQYVGEAAQVARGARAGALRPTTGAPQPLSIGETARVAALPSSAAVAGSRPYALGASLPGLLRSRSPQHAANVRRGFAEGLDLDLGTATGKPFVAGVQKLVDESLGPTLTGTAEKSKVREGQSFATRGQVEAGQVAPLRETNVSSGTGIQSGMGAAERKAGREARQSYTELENLEAAPHNIVDVQRPKRELANLYARRNRRMEKDLGAIPTPEELRELRRIREELRANPYQKGKLVQEDLGRSDTFYAKGSANADVYHDIQSFAPGSTEMTGAEMEASITKALETGAFDDPAMGAMRVARERVAKSPRVSRSPLPPDAGDWGGPDIPTTVRMGMPVNLEAAQQSLRPLFKQWSRRSKVARDQLGDAYTAMRDIVTGPANRPASEVDRLLGALKSKVRLGKETMPEGTMNLRQGSAAYEVKALEQALEAGLARDPAAGPALAAGRAATTEKYRLRRLAKRVTQEEPAAAFNKLTQNGDTNLRLLTAVQEVAPQQVKRVARAQLDQLLDLANQTDDFGNAGAALREWKKLGPETKKVLYGADGVTFWDSFFELGAVRGKIANPSQSFTLGAKAGELAGLGTAIAQGHPSALAFTASTPAASRYLFHSPRVARALTQGFRIPLQSKAARAAWLAQVERELDQLPAEQEP